MSSESKHDQVPSDGDYELIEAWQPDPEDDEGETRRPVDPEVLAAFSLGSSAASFVSPDMNNFLHNLAAAEEERERVPAAAAVVVEPPSTPRRPNHNDAADEQLDKFLTELETEDAEKEDRVFLVKITSAKKAEMDDHYREVQKRRNPKRLEKLLCAAARFADDPHETPRTRSLQDRVEVAIYRCLKIATSLHERSGNPYELFSLLKPSLYKYAVEGWTGYENPVFEKIISLRGDSTRCAEFLAGLEERLEKLKAEVLKKRAEAMASGQDSEGDGTDGDGEEDDDEEYDDDSEEGFEGVEEEEMPVEKEEEKKKEAAEKEEKKGEKVEEKKDEEKKVEEEEEEIIFPFKKSGRNDGVDSDDELTEIIKHIKKKNDPAGFMKMMDKENKDLQAQIKKLKAEIRSVDFPEPIEKAIHGEWRIVRSHNVDEYLEARKASHLKNVVFRSANHHYYFSDENRLLTYQSIGNEVHFENRAVLGEKETKAGVVRESFILDNSLYTFDTCAETGADIGKEKRYVRYGCLHIVRSRNGLSCTRVYERVAHGDVEDQLNAVSSALNKEAESVDVDGTSIDF